MIFEILTAMYEVVSTFFTSMTPLIEVKKVDMTSNAVARISKIKYLVGYKFAFAWIGNGLTPKAFGN